MGSCGLVSAHTKKVSQLIKNTGQALSRWPPQVPSGENKRAAAILTSVKSPTEMFCVAGPNWKYTRQGILENVVYEPPHDPWVSAASSFDSHLRLLSTGAKQLWWHFTVMRAVKKKTVTSETVTVTACIEIPLLPHISMKHTFIIILLLSSILDNRLGVILFFP